MRALTTLLLIILATIGISQELRQNVAYFELAGAQGFYSLNVERTIVDNEKPITARLGLSSKGSSHNVIPGAALLIPSGDNGDRFLEVGAGLVGEFGTISKLYGYMNFGYRKQATDLSPIMWKATITPRILTAPKGGALGIFMPWFGIAVGYGF